MGQRLDSRSIELGKQINIFQDVAQLEGEGLKLRIRELKASQLGHFASQRFVDWDHGAETSPPTLGFQSIPRLPGGDGSLVTFQLVTFKLTNLVNFSRSTQLAKEAVFMTRTFPSLLLMAALALSACGKEVIRSHTEEGNQSPLGTTTPLAGGGTSQNPSGTSVPVETSTASPGSTPIAGEGRSTAGFPYCESRSTALKLALDELRNPRSKDLITQSNTFRKGGLQSFGEIRLRFLGEDCREISGSDRVCGPLYVASLAFAVPGTAPGRSERAIAIQTLVSTTTGQAYLVKIYSQMELQSGSVGTASTSECVTTLPLSR